MALESFPVPAQVVGNEKSRRLAWVVFIIGLAAVIAAVTVNIISVVRLVRSNVQTITVTASQPPLPYIYLCPSSPQVFGLSPGVNNGFMAAGCGDNIASPELTLQRPSARQSYRTDGSCNVALQWVNIMSRVAGGPLNTTCVVFSLPPPNSGDVPWLAQFYLLYNPNVGGNGANKSTADGFGVGTDGLALVPRTISVYFSEYGGSSLVSNGYFLFSQDVLNDYPPFHFLDDHYVLASGYRTEIQVEKTITGLSGNTDLVRFPPAGAVTQIPLPGLVTGLAAYHQLSAAVTADLNGVMMRASISYEQTSIARQSLRAVLQTTIGALAGYFAYFASIWTIFFVPDLEVKYRIRRLHPKKEPLQETTRPQEATEDTVPESAPLTVVARKV